MLRFAMCDLLVVGLDGGVWPKIASFVGVSECFRGCQRYSRKPRKEGCSRCVVVVRFWYWSLQQQLQQFKVKCDGVECNFGDHVKVYAVSEVGAVHVENRIWWHVKQNMQRSTLFTYDPTSATKSSWQSCTDVGSKIPKKRWITTETLFLLSCSSKVRNEAAACRCDLAGNALQVKDAAFNYQLSSCVHLSATGIACVASISNNESLQHPPDAAMHLLQQSIQLPEFIIKELSSQEPGFQFLSAR